MPKRIKRTRNADTWSESQYWGAVRSALRKAFRYWKPATSSKLRARRAYVGANKRQKWEYCCASCGKWFKEREIHIDHITPVGSLRSSSDLAKFLERLTPEEGFQVLCKPCHYIKINKERKKKSEI